MLPMLLGVAGGTTAVLSATAPGLTPSSQALSTQNLLLVRDCVLLALLAASAYTDLSQGRLFNKVTIPALVAGLVLNYWMGGVWAGSLLRPSFLASLAAACIGGGLFLWPYLKGGIAAGDVKLMAAVGAIGTLSHYYLIYALLYASFAGAFMALAVLVWKGRLVDGLKRSLTFLFERRRTESEAKEADRPKLMIPYGLAIAVGSLAAWLVTLARASR